MSRFFNKPPPPHLDETEINMISEQSGVEPGIVQSWYKEFLILCPAGKLDRKHFHKFYKQLIVHPCENLEKIVDYVFTSFDRDSNGILEFHEFLIAYAITSRSEPDKKLEFIFWFYDTDKDGYLTDKEFLVALEKLYLFRKMDKDKYPPSQCVRDVFLKCDENGDHRLTKDEFVEGCLRNDTLIELLSPFYL